MQERKKINEVIPNWLIGSGIFSALNGYAVPWQYENIASELDLEYHGNISGDKYVSPLVNKVLGTDTTLSDTDLTTLAGVIYNLYGKNWEKLWNTLDLEYNPIENYNMVEKMSNDETVIDYGRSHTRTDNTTHSKTGTDTITPNLTERTTPNLVETTTPNLSDTTDNSVFGFNSSTAVGANSSSNSKTGTNTVAQSGMTTTTNTGNSTTGYNTQDRNTGTVTDNDNGSDTHTRNYTLTRSGNIGVTTSQMMIESERSLQKWYYFFEVVFPDIDRVLTLSIY